MFKVPNENRIRIGQFGSNDDIKNNAAFLIPFQSFTLRVTASDGQGWEHVSVSLPNRYPNWREIPRSRGLNVPAAFFGAGHGIPRGVEAQRITHQQVRGWDTRERRDLLPLSITGPVLCVPTRPPPPPSLGVRSGLCGLEAAGQAYADADGPGAGSHGRPASPAPSAWLPRRAVRAAPAPRGRSPREAGSTGNQGLPSSFGLARPGAWLAPPRPPRAPGGPARSTPGRLPPGPWPHPRPPARARLERGWGQRRWTSAPRPPRAAGLDHDARADRRRPPRAWAAAPLARPPARLLGAGRCRRRRTSTPPDWHGLAGRRAGCRGRRLGGGRGLGGRLRPGARMPHHHTARGARFASGAVLALPRSAHPLALPAPGRLGLPPPGWRHPQGPGGGARPQAARAGRTAPGRGTSGTRALVGARQPPRGRRLAACLAATRPRTPSTPTARHAARAPGGAPRALRWPARRPTRPGSPPSPRTPRRRRTGVRSSRPSGRGPEAGRGAPGGCGAAADASERALGVGACGSQGGGSAATARAWSASAPQRRWRGAAHRAARLGPPRASGRAARGPSGCRNALRPRAARRWPPVERPGSPSRRARPTAATPRPEATTGAGWGGLRPSSTGAPSRRRPTPSTNGTGAPGSLCWTARALRHLLSSLPSTASSRRRGADTSSALLPRTNRVGQPVPLNVG